MTEDGIGLMLRPVSERAGHSGQLGVPDGMIGEAIGMMAAPDGVDSEVDTQKGTHAGVEVVADEDGV